MVLFYRSHNLITVSVFDNLDLASNLSVTWYFFVYVIVRYVNIYHGYLLELYPDMRIITTIRCAIGAFVAIVIAFHTLLEQESGYVAAYLLNLEKIK